MKGGSVAQLLSASRQRRPLDLLLERRTSRPVAAMTNSANSATPTPKRSVYKFGGSSVGSPLAFRSCAGVITANHEAGNQTVTVLSAMYGVTNKLLDAATSAGKGNVARVQKLRGELLDLHGGTAKELINKKSRRDECMGYIEFTFSDRISSVGERWSSRIMSSFLQDQGYDSPLFESDTIIVTDDVSGNARPILDATRRRVAERLLPSLDRGALPVVTGFFGASETGKLTTLGRGGSDLTAAVLGYCVDADDVSLWKVEYTTRPDGWMDKWAAGWEGVVHDAEPSVTIPRLSYEEAAEMAHFGKKVLHPETVMPAVEKAIPITVRNTINPSHPGTRIEWHPSSSRSSRVQAVTRVPLRTYETKNAPLTDLDLTKLNVRREDAALVVLVGLNIMAIPGLEERVLVVLREAVIPAHVPRRVNGSANNFSVLVPESRLTEATKLLHERIVKPSSELQASEAEGKRLDFRVAYGARMMPGGVAAKMVTDSPR